MKMIGNGLRLIRVFFRLVFEMIRAVNAIVYAVI